MTSGHTFVAPSRVAAACKGRIRLVNMDTGFLEDGPVRLELLSNGSLESHGPEGALAGVKDEKRG